MAKRMTKTKKHYHKSRKHNRKSRKHRGGRGYTSGASSTLAQMAPASINRFIGAGLAFLNGGRR